MRPNSRWVIIATLALVLATALQAKDEFWAQVTFLKGTATFIAAGSLQPQPLKRGAVLHRGDSIKAGDASQVSLLLSDGGVLVVRASSEVVLGKNPGASDPNMKVVASNLSRALLSREGDNPMLKHLGGLRGAEKNLALAPCRTKVRSTGLQLIWGVKPGVAKYAVTLMGPDDSITESTTSDTSMPVPPGKLIAGGVYYWEVRDASARDTLSILGSGTFTTLEKKTEQEVASLEKAIATAYPNPGEDTTPQFLGFQIYRERGMNLDALQVLNRILKADPSDTELLRMRKDLCEEMGISEPEASRLLGTP